MSQLTTPARVEPLRQGFLVSTESADTAPAEVTLLHRAAAAELLTLGFLVDAAELRTLSKADLEQSVEAARQVTGANRNWKPVYPDFPDGVKATPTLQLIWDQIVHYMSEGTVFPDAPDTPRAALPLEEMLTSAKPVEVISATELANQVFQNILCSRVAWSQSDKDLVATAVSIIPPSDAWLKGRVSLMKNHENIQTLVGMLNADPNHMVELLAPVMKTADALLRLVLVTHSVSVSVSAFPEEYKRAVYHLSDTDHYAVQMLSMSRPARAAVLKRLGEVTLTGYYADSLTTRRLLWQRVMRMIHPFTASGRKEKGALRAVNIIAGNIEYTTLASEFTNALEQGAPVRAAKLLADYAPGLLTRNLVALARKTKTEAAAQAVADIAESALSQVALTTLISAYNGVSAAGESHPRIVRMAGRSNKKLDSDQVEPLSAEVMTRYQRLLLNAMKGNLQSSAIPAGVVGTKCDTPVPLEARTASATDRKSMMRGERFTISGEGDVLRLFSHWRNTGDSPGYVDLSVALLNKKFEFISAVTWDSWNRGNARNYSTYSGDTFVQPGNAAVEFIDIELEKLKATAPDTEWVTLNLISWSGPQFDTLDVYAGLMFRNAAQAGEVFDPRTVLSAAQPSVKSTLVVVLAVNVHSKEVFWVDSTTGLIASTTSAAQHGVGEELGVITRQELSGTKLTVGQLANLWAEAHNVAADPDQAADVASVVALL